MQARLLMENTEKGTSTATSACTLELIPVLHLHGGKWTYSTPTGFHLSVCTTGWIAVQVSAMYFIPSFIPSFCDKINKSKQIGLAGILLGGRVLVKFQIPELPQYHNINTILQKKVSITVINQYQKLALTCMKTFAHI